MRQIILLLLLLGLVLPALSETNRCGEIQDDRTVYTGFYDPSNGHQILEIRITAVNTSSGHSWIDIVNDTDKWDKWEPMIYGEVMIGSDPSVACEIQRRGDWSMESPLPSIRVKFFKGTKYRDMDRLLLNKHPWDPTRVKNKLSFELLQEIPNLSSLYTHFVHLFVNDQSYGIYTMVEDIRDDMMKTHGLKKSSNLYKANKVSWNLAQDVNVKEVDNPSYDEANFEKNWDVRGEKNHSILIKAYTQIFDANLDSKSVMENNFNVDNFATWLAFVILTGNNDLVFNNFGIYAPKDRKDCAFPTPLYMMAWDNDGGWGENPQEKEYGTEKPYYYTNIPYFWNSRLVKRFYQTNSNVDLLLSKMEWLVNNTMSAAKIRSLTDSYKPIIRPILEAAPDKDHLAWDNDISGWSEYVDGMSLIPLFHYNNMRNSVLLRPMPVHSNFSLSSDSSSLFFWWEKSFVLYNKEYFYDFQISSSSDFSSPLVSEVTNNTFISVPTSLFSASTTYYWRLLIRNTESPSFYMESYPSLTDETGWGISTFITPSSLSPVPSAPAPIVISHSASFIDPVSGEEYKYATLDDVDPSSSSPSPCSSSLSSIPSGWMLAPNSALTLSHLSSLSLPFGGSSLVLADGRRVSAAGKQLEGFGEFSQHFSEFSVENGKAYVANCTVGNVHILITNFRGDVAPTEVPTSGPNPTESPIPSDGPNPTNPTEPAPSSSPSDPSLSPLNPSDAPTRPDATSAGVQVTVLPVLVIAAVAFLAVL